MFRAEHIVDYIIAVVLAMSGGLASILNKKTKLKVTQILAEMFIAGFAGLMVLLLARASGLTGYWLGLVCGMAGWIGPKILDAISKPVGSKIGVEVDREDEPK